MEIKNKPIDKNNWVRVLKRKCAITEIEEFEGVAYLIKIEEVTEPLIKFCFGKNVVLADNGYYWMQIGLKNKNFWLTVMYDENCKFVQYYFDVTKNNIIDGEKSYFEDLFLDVIIQGEGEIQIIDLEDLDNALKEGVILKDEFDFAHKEASKIVKNVLKNRDECDKLCIRYFNLLRNKLGEK